MQSFNFKHTELCLVVAASIVVLTVHRMRLVDCKDAKIYGQASVHLILLLTRH